MDADACPRAVKDILYRAADRTGIQLVLVAHQPLSVPRRRNILALCVAPGLDAADQEITRRCQSGDLVVTSDIPLAAEVVEKGAVAVNPRGVLYTRENVRQQLSMRDFMADLRGAGVDTGGPSGYGDRDRQAFAGQLDRWLAQRPQPAKGS